MATAQPQQPDGMMEEYGVDWSKWVSRVVDQWFVKLQQLEGNSGLQFHTQGPALLKFTAYPDGHIEILGLKRSSGVPMYDQMQADALVQSQPLPAFPRGTKKTSYTLVQGWDSHPKQENEQDFQLGSYKGNLPMEKIRQWIPGR